MKPEIWHTVYSQWSSRCSDSTHNAEIAFLVTYLNEFTLAVTRMCLMFLKVDTICVVPFEILISKGIPRLNSTEKSHYTQPVYIYKLDLTFVVADTNYHRPEHVQLCVFINCHRPRSCSIYKLFAVFATFCCNSSRYQWPNIFSSIALIYIKKLQRFLRFKLAGVDSRSPCFSHLMPRRKDMRWYCMKNNISFEPVLFWAFGKGKEKMWHERLSVDCVGASSVNIFKNKIDIYLRRAGYT